MLTRPFCIVPQPDEGTLGPGSTGCLSPGDCPGVGIQAGVPGASAPFSISPDASFTAEPSPSFRVAEHFGIGGRVFMELRHVISFYHTAKFEDQPA